MIVDVVGNNLGTRLEALAVVYFQTVSVVLLRVQCHAHACIFGWLLGDCISETTADYSKKPKTYATRLAKAVHIANYER